MKTSGWMLVRLTDMKGIWTLCLPRKDVLLYQWAHFPSCFSFWDKWNKNKMLPSFSTSVPSSKERVRQWWWFTRTRKTWGKKNLSNLTVCMRCVMGFIPWAYCDRSFLVTALLWSLLGFFFDDREELLTMIMSTVHRDLNHVTVSVGPCESAPCLNGGQCVRVDGANFTCKCPPDYTGHRCEMFGRFLCPSVCACMCVSICEYVCLCNMCVCLFVSVCLSVCL